MGIETHWRDVPSGKLASFLSRRKIAGHTLRGTIVTKIRRGPPILMYHGVGWIDDDPFALFVTPERFAEQMLTLRILGLCGVSLGELGDAIARGEARGLVGLTFDDGYNEVVTTAAPVLQRLGFSATMFAVSGLLGGENVWDLPPRRALIDRANIDHLARQGWEIGSHSVTHARLTQLSPDDLYREVSESRGQLGALLGGEPRSFCYPYGLLDEKAVTAVREAGYAYACAVDRVPGMADRWAMPRIGVSQRDRGLRFVARLLLRGH